MTLVYTILISTHEMTSLHNSVIKLNILQQTIIVCTCINIHHFNVIYKQTHRTHVTFISS